MNYSRLAFLIGLGICLPVQAQQVPNPATAPVATNAALKTTPGDPQGKTRLGFYAAGDGGYQQYNWSSTNCTAADDGAQVQPTGTGCWIADFDKAAGANVRVWGAKGDDTTDDAPVFRKACAYALSAAGQGTSVMIPPGRYQLKTLDSRGNGVVYLTNGVDDGRACSLIGTQSAADYAATNAIGGPSLLILGPGLNRPMMYVPKLGASPHLRNLTIFSLKTDQAGWAGGPNGKLYLVQAENAGPDTYPETGPIFDSVTIQNGFNGNVYIGGGRYMWSDRLWSMYSGQAVGDCSIWNESSDSFYIATHIGSNTGCGLYQSGGAQNQMFGGAIWSNTGAGLLLGGLQINYMSIVGTNFQYNAYGIANFNYPPYAGTVGGGITCTNCTFDGNNTADLYIYPGSQVNRQMKLVSPNFVGNLIVAGAKPVYNIDIPSGAGIVDVISPSLGSAGAPYTSGFTNSPGLVYCTGHECPSSAFLPTLGNGTPTYNLQQGYIMRAGHLAHLSLVLSTTALGSPTGNMSVGNIPYSSTSQTNYAAPCAIGTVAGWTPPAGSNWLTAQIPGGSNSIQLFRNSVVGGGSTASSASEWGVGSGITISCTYVPAT